MKKTSISFRPSFKRNLPHFQPKDGVFFVTYRLNFSLPDYLIKMLIENTDNPDLEDYLDHCINSPDWLKTPEIARLVIDSWLFLNGIKYDLFCITVMSNHVHVIFKPLQKGDFPFSISEIIKGTKTHTAREANKIMGRSGQFWAREYYDHFIRTEEQLRFYIRYILDNPVKAGLVKKFDDWDFTWIKNELLIAGY